MCTLVYTSRVNTSSHPSFPIWEVHQLALDKGGSLFTGHAQSCLSQTMTKKKRRRVACRCRLTSIWGGEGRAEGLYKTEQRAKRRTNTRAPFVSSSSSSRCEAIWRLCMRPNLHPLLSCSVLSCPWGDDGGAEVCGRVVGGRVRAGVRRAGHPAVQRERGPGDLDGGQLAGKGLEKHSWSVYFPVR